MSTPAPDGREAADLLRLDRLPGVGPVRVRALVRAFGTAGRALAARDQDFAALAGRAAAHARRDIGLRRDVDAALERADRCGIKVLTWSDARYPPALWHLADPPPVLFARGRIEFLEGPAVTVVGARRATERGRDVAERLGAALGRAGVRVWSGLALGVDAAVHAGALQERGGTVAVLGTGPDVVYPRLHARLFDEISHQGLRVSEFLPGTGAAPHHFPRRNRILAAIAGTTVVVEAGARSGALITVDHALDLGRDVWVVPGPIERSFCVGSNRLLADGARPLISIPSFVAAVAGPAHGVDAHPAGHHGGEGAADFGDGVAARVMAALAAAPLGVDDLADQCGVPVDTALAVLTTLELHGEVQRVSGMRYRRAA